MIEIKVTDPYATEPGQLRAVAAFLTAIADNKPAAAMLTHTHSPQTIRTTDPAPTLAPEDNPAAGTDAAEVFAGGANPAEVFAGGANPAEVFAAGNATGAVNAPSIAVAVPSSTAPAATSGTSTNPTESLPNAAQNAQGAATVAASVPPGPTSAPGVDLDKNGLPWDARIHSESKNKNKDGSWRNKRGVAPEVVTAVEAELRAVLGVPAPAGNVPPPPPVAGSPVAPAPTSQVAVQPAASVAPESGVHAASAIPSHELGNVPPPPPPTGVVPPPPPANTAPAAQVVTPIASATSPATGTPVENAPAPSITFPQLCARITNALNGGQLTQERLGQVLGAHKLQGLPTLAAFPHLVGTVATELGFA